MSIRRPLGSGDDANGGETSVGMIEPSFLGRLELGVRVLQRSYQWSAGPGKRAGEENGIVIAYDSTNTGSVAASIVNVRVGLGLAADILTNGAGDDIVHYDDANNILYMYDSGELCATDPAIGCTNGHLGIALLADATTRATSGTVVAATATCCAAVTVSVCPTLQPGDLYELMRAGINASLTSATPV